MLQQGTTGLQAVCYTRPSPSRGLGRRGSARLLGFRAISLYRYSSILRERQKPAMVLTFLVEKFLTVQLLFYLVVLQAELGETLIDSLPCEADGEDPDAQNPMDNLSCPFSDEVLLCIPLSEICDGEIVCTGGYDEGRVSEQIGSGSGEMPSIVVLECSKFALRG